jgi:hypothetical protein
MRKIVQIAFEPETDSYGGELSESISSTMWALCDDGTLWQLRYCSGSRGYIWEYCTLPIPQDDIHQEARSK